MVSVRPFVVLLFALLLPSCEALGDLVTPPPTQDSHPVDFDDLLVLAEHSQSAYGTESEIAARYGAEVRHGALPLSDIRYFVVDDGARQVVAIRGTSSLANVAVDAVVSLERANGLDIDMHEGFLRVGQQLSVDLGLQLDRERPVLLTGHSLGGALAVVSGLYLDVGGYDVQAVTFGQPKFTTREGALSLTRGGTGLLLDRVVFRGDPVADMPPYLPDDDVLRYAHLGPEILLWTDTTYAYLEPGQILHDADLMALTELPAGTDLTPHAIDGYVARLTRLREASHEVPYLERHGG